MRRLAAAVLVLGICCYLTGVLLAQSSNASLTGLVTDPSKAVIVGAKINVINEGTNVRYEGATNSSGSYYVAGLPPGVYRVEVEKTGFKTVLKPSVVLHVQDTVEVNFEMAVGSTTESVTVEGGAPLVNAESAAVGTVVDRQFVGNLPLNGRSFQSLILLTPGVVVTATDSGNPGQFSVNGQRSNANYFAVDGVSANTGAFSIGASPTTITTSQTQAGVLPSTTTFGGTNGLVSIDSLAEFKIQTSTYAAEFGRQPGGQISVATRSGSNQFHGSAFDYLRNDIFDANDWFANAAGKSKAPLRQNMFGGTLGGPLLAPHYNGRNKAFFFFSYEGLRLRLPQATVIQVPSLRVRQAADPAIKPILAGFPLPMGAELTNAGQPLGTAPFTGVYSDPSTFDTTSVRLDHALTHKVTLFGRFNNADSTSQVRNSRALSQIDESTITDRSITLGATATITDRLLNDLRFNIDHSLTTGASRLDNFGGALAPDLASAISPAFSSALPDVYSIFQYSLTSGFGGLQKGPGTSIRQRQLNLVDSLSWAKGTHRAKFGIDYRRLAGEKSPLNFQNTIFTSESQLQSATASLIQLVSFRGSTPIFTNLSFYGQDTWKASRRLTLDYGLRWDINPAPNEISGQKPVVLTEVSNLATAQLAPANAPIYETDLTGFAPRVGAAYEFSDKAGWERVLRDGFGVFYDTGNGQASKGYYAFPFLLQTLLSNARLPIPASQAVVPSPIVTLPLTQTLTVMDPHLRLPYTLEWNVAIEQGLGAKQVFTVSYVASAGRRLITTQSGNRIPTGGAQPNPNFSTITVVFNQPTSDYQSLQLQFRRQLSHGLQTLFNYTLSHAIDESSDEVSVGLLNRGNANFDVQHNFSAALSYELPGRRLGSVWGMIFGNWSAEGIAHAQSALPVDLIASGSFVNPEGLLINRRPDLVPGVPLYLSDPTVPGGRRFNSAAFLTPPTGRQGTFGRNVMRGLSIYQVDPSLRRTIKLTEKLNVQFKAEAFNVSNHPNFGGFGNRNATPSTFGVPTQMLGRSLGGLSPLYQIGGPRSMQFSLRLAF